MGRTTTIRPSVENKSGNNTAFNIVDRGRVRKRTRRTRRETAPKIVIESRAPFDSYSARAGTDQNTNFLTRDVCTRSALYIIPGKNTLAHAHINKLIYKGMRVYT